MHTFYIAPHGEQQSATSLSAEYDEQGNKQGYVCGAYQAERAGANLNPGLPVGGCHPHAILHDGDHGPLLLLLHIPLLWA